MSKALIIVDLEVVVRNLSQRKGLYDLFSRFTLSDMIEQILSIDPYIDYSQHVYDALERRFDDDEYAINMELFELLFESIVTQVDEQVRHQYKDVIEQLEYKDGSHSIWLFERWVGQYSVLIRLEV